MFDIYEINNTILENLFVSSNFLALFGAYFFNFYLLNEIIKQKIKKTFYPGSSPSPF
jgi:hypothetical protein